MPSATEGPAEVGDEPVEGEAAALVLQQCPSASVSDEDPGTDEPGEEVRGVVFALGAREQVEDIELSTGHYCPPWWSWQAAPVRAMWSAATGASQSLAFASVTAVLAAGCSSTSGVAS